VGTGAYRAAAEALASLPVRVLMTTGQQNAAANRKGDVTFGMDPNRDRIIRPVIVSHVGPSQRPRTVSSR
jgi:hypothetical protein